MSIKDPSWPPSFSPRHPASPWPNAAGGSAQQTTMSCSEGNDLGRILAVLRARGQQLIRRQPE